MDITFSAEELAFRDQVRTFLSENWTEDLAARINARDGDYKAAQIEWQNRLNAKGWLAPGWPVEHGGVDWSVTEPKTVVSCKSNQSVSAGLRDNDACILSLPTKLLYTSWIVWCPST